MPNCNINELHMLEDMAGMYNAGSAHMVVTEAIANAIEGNADRIQIVLKNQKIAFIDNGNGMNKREFKHYHDIAGQNKRKGTGIGFAGIGAKVYLGAWRHSRIRTETYGDDGPLASDMYISRNNKIMWESVEDVGVNYRGTRYEVYLKKSDYNILEKSLGKIITDVFNPSLINGIQVYINNEKLEPWVPSNIKEYKHEAMIGSKKYPICISIFENPDSMKKFVQYHVLGKIISSKSPEWISEIDPKYQSKIHVYVDALKMSGYLNTNKESFNRGKQTGEFYRGIESFLYKILKKEKYLLQDLEQTAGVKIDNLLEDIFNAQEWLNPFSRKAVRIATSTQKQSESEHVKTVEKTKKETTAVKGTARTIKLIAVRHPNDPRDGWVNPANGQIMLNESHPLYNKYKTNREARNFLVKNIIFSALIKNGSKTKEINTADAFSLLSEMMTKTKDAIVI